MGHITVEWSEDLQFEGRSDGHVTAIDGRAQTGPSPVDLLLESVAACVGIDVVDILQKGREDLRGLAVEVEGQRQESAPRYVKQLSLRFVLRGDLNRGKVERAVDLALEKYCSVFHTFRKDMGLDIEIDIRPAS